MASSRVCKNPDSQISEDFKEKLRDKDTESQIIIQFDINNLINTKEIE